jgi:hypothetical protein
MASELLNSAVCKLEFLIELFIYLRYAYVVCCSKICKALELLICNVCVLIYVNGCYINISDVSNTGFVRKDG